VEVRLARLFEQLFSADELLRWAYDIGGSELRNTLPGAQMPLATVASAVASALVRRQLVNERLFASLKKIRPRAVQLVDATLQQVQGQPELGACVPVDRVGLYQALVELNASQFGEVLFLMGLDRNPHLPPASTTASSRAQALIQMIEQQSPELHRLRTTLSLILPGKKF